MVDSVQGIDDLIATPLQSGKKWSVFLEVDCGYGRSKLLGGFYVIFTFYVMVTCLWSVCPPLPKISERVIIVVHQLPREKPGNRYYRRTCRISLSRNES
jgi:hypothetical protein